MIAAFIIFTIGVVLWLSSCSALNMGGVVAGWLTMAAGAGAVVCIGLDRLLWALL